MRFDRAGSETKSRARACAAAAALTPALALLLAMARPAPAAAAGAPADSAAAAATAAPAPAPSRHILEAGAAYGDHTGGFGRADAQFVRYQVARPDAWGWRFDLGRSARFGDTSLDAGAAYTAHLTPAATWTLGVATGTGDIIAPRYRLDFSLAAPVLGFAARVGFLRVQSKAENSSDGVGLSLARYLGRWVVSAGGKYEVGRPGGTVSTSGGFGLAYLVWRRTHVGAGADFGDVSYQLVGPGAVLVDYRSSAYHAGWTQWLGASSGFNLRLDWGDTPFYEVWGVTLGLFKEW